MTASAIINLQIGNAVPHGNAKDTRDIIALWQEIGRHFHERRFVAQGRIDAQVDTYNLTLDASALLTALEHAQAVGGSFDEYHRAHVGDETNSIAASMMLTIVADDALDETEAYQVATLFWQQLVMAANLVLPGSIQLLDTHYAGPGAHRYEAQVYDSQIMHGAYQTASANGWPSLQPPSFQAVWDWLDKCQVAHAHTAITNLNKVLFTLLKVAEQRHEYSARTVLLVVYQLEVLLDCRNTQTFQRIRNRARLVLSAIPEGADCFKGLYDVRNSLFLSDHPVHRPPLICHNTVDWLREQTDQHNNTIELGTAIVLALLHDLIAENATGYAFSEVVSRRP